MNGETRWSSGAWLAGLVAFGASAIAQPPPGPPPSAREGAPAASAEAGPGRRPDPHPIVAGYERALREWLTPSEARALDRIALTGTAGGDDARLEELLRHTLFRELGGRALVGLPHPELRRYGYDIRRLPRRPPDPEASAGNDAPFAHANMEAYWNALGDLESACSSGGREGSDDASEECSGRFERARAAGIVAHFSYDDLDVARMVFVDAGLPLGDGQEHRAPPRRLADLFAEARRAGLPRALIRRTALALLRSLVREASR